ncbi:MAG: hypothetical protein ACK40M_00615 [Flavobacteriales bacterium]
MNKSLLFCVLVFAALTGKANAQSSDYFGFKDAPGFISFGKDSTTIIGINGSHVIVWDVKSSKILKERKFGEIYRDGFEYAGKKFRGNNASVGFPCLNASRTLIGFSGSGFEEVDNLRNEINTVFIFYDIERDKWHHVVDPSKEYRLQKFYFNSPDSNRVAAILMDNTSFDYTAVNYSLTEQKIQHKLFVGKGALIPLECSFSSDSKTLFVGYGSSSYGGGLDVYNLETGKLIKRIPMNDQPARFYEWNNLLVLSGHSGSYFYSKSNWALVHTQKNLEITSVDYTNNRAIGTFIQQGDRRKLSELMVFDLASKKVIVRNWEKSSQHQVFEGSNMVISIRFKDYYNTAEHRLDIPSVLLRRL